LTIRLPEALVPELKRAATTAGRSLNAWVAAVLAAAVDPELAGDEAQAVRERLARAGLLMPSGRPLRRPGQDDVARARARAGEGQMLARLVSEGRF
jgi:hypothetical protein